MKKPIEWSPRARNEYLSIVGYLLEEWGEKVAGNYVRRIKEVLNTIAERPKLYPATGKRKNVRRCVVSKQTSLYYRIRRDCVQVVTLFDNRQDPNKIKI